MAKLFIQDIPTREELDVFLKNEHGLTDSWPIYTNFLFMKVATELENYMDNILLPHNLSSGRFTLLILLTGQPDGMIPSELSQKVGVTQATISGLLNSLEKSDLVRRESHAKDGRSFVIKITDKGKNLIKELLPVWASRVGSFWNQVGADQKNSLDSILDKMAKSTGVLS